MSDCLQSECDSIHFMSKNLKTKTRIFSGADRSYARRQLAGEQFPGNDTASKIKENISVGSSQVEGRRSKRTLDRARADRRILGKPDHGSGSVPIFIAAPHDPQSGKGRDQKWR